MCNLLSDDAVSAINILQYTSPVKVYIKVKYISTEGEENIEADLTNFIE